jgi:hypothetical protein
VEALLFPVLNVHSVNDVRQILVEIHTDEPLVGDPTPFEVEIAIAKLEKHKSPGSNDIRAELIQSEGETQQPEIHKLINYLGIRKNCP